MKVLDRLFKFKNQVKNQSVLRPVAVPSGFSWAPPINFYRKSNGVFTTNYNPNDWKVAATASLYVATTGNDTTGTGTELLPYKTIKKALQAAALLVDDNINIFVKAGEYRFNEHFSGQTCDKNINVVATGGRVTCTNKFAIASWNAAGVGTYTATRSGIVDIRDSRYTVIWPDGSTTPQLLPKVTDLVTCQSTPGSWYTDGVAIWVHLSDGRLPDSAANQDVGCIFGSNSVNIASANRNVFIQGFDFEGGLAGCVKAQPASGVSINRVVVDDCTFRFQRGPLDKSVNLQGVVLGIVSNCTAYLSEGDAFSYSQVNSSSPSTNAIEINCTGYSAGYLSTNTKVQNGSTQHAAGRIIRVNCHYAGAYGPVVADIGTTQSWNMNVSTKDCLLTSEDSQDTCFQCGDSTGITAKMWLDGCSVNGAFYDLWVGPNCQIKYRNMVVSNTSGDIATY